MAWNIARRHFLLRGLHGFLLLILGRLLGVAPAAATVTSKGSGNGRSRVISVHHPSVSADGDGFDNEHLDVEVTRRMVNRGVLEFTGENDLVQAWRKIIPDPGKKVAIKVNCQIRGIYSKAKVVQPLIEGLRAIGVPPDHIIIYDMTDNAFDLAGFVKNLGPGIKVGTAEDFGGYSRFLYHRLANLLTGGYQSSVWNYLAQVERETRFESVRFAARSLLADRRRPWDCAYIINVPVLKALEGYSGLSLSMKNHYGSFGNPGEHHGDIMDYIPFINNLPEIREKTRLVVLDSIFGEYKWVNGRDQRYVSRVNRIIISDDPVAIDAIGWGLIEDLRKQHGVGPVTPAPVFIGRAASLGLGIADRNSIDLQEIHLPG